MRIQRIGMLAAAAALALFLVAAWPVNAANAQSYWGHGMDYTETGQGWQWNAYGYGYYQAYSAGYQQGLSDAQTGLTHDCSGHTQYYCDGYSQGFNTYGSQQQTQSQGAENNVKGNSNYISVNQQQSTGIGSYLAPRDDNNGNGNGYDSSIQPGQVNPSCKIICLTIIK